MKTISTIVALALLSMSCGLKAADSNEPVGKAIKPAVVITGADSRVTTPQYHRITSNDDWTRVWQEHMGKATPRDADHNGTPYVMPEIDFDQCTVIAVFQGKGFNSRGLKAVSVIEQDERIVFRYDDISYQTFGPVGSKGADDVTAYGFFVLPRSEKPVVVEEDVQNILGQPPRWLERATFPRLPH